MIAATSAVANGGTYALNTAQQTAIAGKTLRFIGMPATSASIQYLFVGSNNWKVALSATNGYNYSTGSSTQPTTIPSTISVVLPTGASTLTGMTLG